MRDNSKIAFDANVVTLEHACKFSRKFREYMHIYRDGVTGIEEEYAIKKYKTHCSLAD